MGDGPRNGIAFPNACDPARTRNVTILHLTWDLSAWYAGRSMVALLLLAGLAAWGFYTALGGRALFGLDLLEADAPGKT